MTSSQFDVLVLGKEEKLSWEWGSAPSDKAVRCDLEESFNYFQESEDGDCFLGQGVYSDGICEEVSTALMCASMHRICRIPFLMQPSPLFGLSPKHPLLTTNIFSGPWLHQTKSEEYLHDCLWPGGVLSILPFSHAELIF